jgi:hypothetical protein
MCKRAMSLKERTKYELHNGNEKTYVSQCTCLVTLRSRYLFLVAPRLSAWWKRLDLRTGNKRYPTESFKS